MKTITRIRPTNGVPGPVVLENLRGKKLPGGKTDNGRVGGLPSSRKGKNR